MTPEHFKLADQMVKECNMMLPLLKEFYEAEDTLYQLSFTVLDLCYLATEFSRDVTDAATASIATVTALQLTADQKNLSVHEPFSFELSFSALRSQFYRLRTLCGETNIHLPTRVDRTRVWDIDDEEE